MKKKKPGKKRQLSRFDGNPSQKEKKQDRPTPKGSSSPRISPRPRETGSGFGVVKIVVGLIVALIVGSMIFFNQSGGRERARGDKMPQEKCRETSECAAGSVCYSYKDDEKRCRVLCAKTKICEPGFTCVSAAKQKRRRGVRLLDICVEDARL
ncbi:MAG: hypothetical protein QNJ97_08100 [Myxococcota bacterium]|nr:hypothetical protein [Myxococcota bacterium]